MILACNRSGSLVLNIFATLTTFSSMPLCIKHNQVVVAVVVVVKPGKIFAFDCQPNRNEN